MKTIEVEVQGRRYLWNGHTWTDDRFLKPPTKVRNLLMSRLVRQLRRTRNAALDRTLVVNAAEACAETGHLDDARELAERVLRADPKHVGAVVLLAGILRKLRLPRQAIKATEPFVRRRNAELLTARAAAYCDISDWDEADKLVRRAIAIDKAEATPETLRVLARVVAAKARSA